MEKIDPSKVHGELRDRVTPVSPIMGRKYTVTHSDETADLFITIGRHYADDKIEPLRDEVLLTYENTETGMILLGEVLIEDENITGQAKRRSEIFEREMPKALQAIRIADSKLFQTKLELDELPILIWFRSTDPEYNKLYDFGTMSDYR